MSGKAKKFDVIVIGAGSGLSVSSAAAERGLKVAVIDKGPFGGTCLNRGCIPSKMLIHSADVVEDIRRAQLFGIKAKVTGIDWKKIVKRVTATVDGEAREIEEGNRGEKNITVYRDAAKFTGPKTLQVGKDSITADKIVIAVGTRPGVPPIPGLEGTPYVTSDGALRLPRQPKKMVIIGGGYIAAELAHFFGGLGTQVTILQRGPVLVNNEDEEVSQRFTEAYQQRFTVLLNVDTKSIAYKAGKFAVEVQEQGAKKPRKLACDTLLVATGRISNADTLDLAKAGVKLTDKGNYVQVDEFMETNVSGIWALGDIAGKYFFKHSANLEAEYVVQNMFHPTDKVAVNYAAMPHAMFASPQAAGVGLTEQELKAKGVPYAKGFYRYYGTGMGKAIEDEEGFVKVLADPATRKILGCHILGTDASTLIHEVVVVMRAGLGVDAILDAVHVHPALSEVVQRAFINIDWEPAKG
jgi:dihydrolipoamide dehydrogenase